MIANVVVNMVDVVVAGIAMFVAGMVWYSPALFAKQWMHEMKISEKDMAKNKDKMMGTMVQSLIVGIVMAYVLAHIFGAYQVANWMEAVQGAFWLWLGFIATSLYMGVLYEQKSMRWWSITAGHYLFGLIVAGLVLVLL